MAEVPLPTPTQVPVPSTDIRNAVFAGAKLDEEVTGTGEFYTDRLGVKRLTNTGRNNQFEAAQLDRANRFEQFLLSSGYVFLGDYEDGPFQFSARNQYIRYDNQYYRLNAATDVGFTTTGTDATSFANDVTHFVLMDGDTLRSNLGSSESYLGGALVNIGQATVRDVVRANIFSYMTKADQLAIKGTVGTEVVVDYALQAAIDDGVMELHFPPVKGIYVLGASPVTLPSGFSITGVSFRPYTAYSNASFNNKGTVLRLASGSPSIFILTNSHRFFNVSFDGRDRSVPFMRGIGSDQTQNCQYYRCGFYRWFIGVGGSSSTGYTAGIRVHDCSIASNYTGVRNVIDSLFIGTNINANHNHGVELMA
ncbi:hypothetical protein ACPVDH_001220, partial [Klebsiella pneumoniae]